MLDDLPELNEINQSYTNNRFSDSEYPQNGFSMIPADEAEKYKKYIRESMQKIPVQAGMNSPSNMMFTPINRDFEREKFMYVQQQNQELPPQYTHNNQKYRSIDNYTGGLRDTNSNTPNPTNTQPQILPQNPIVDPIVSCNNIYDHIKTCQVCERLYKSQMYLYLIIIAFLTLLCFFLIKKVLNL
jgi:hypothetical protein